jgi:hypothetical protein
MARMVDEAANFVSVQLIGQYLVFMTNATQNKVDLAWERITYETKILDPG